MSLCCSYHCCCCLVAKSCLTLLQPHGLYVAHQALLPRGFPRQEYWSGLPFPSPGDLPDSGIKLASPVLAGGFFTTEPLGKPILTITKLQLQYWHDWSWSSNTLATWCWERLRAGGEGSYRGWDGWMTSPSQWTWVWASSRRWWRTGKPGMLQSIGSQRVEHDLAAELHHHLIYL